MVPGVPVKMKIQGEHVSVQSTKHGKIRQHKTEYNEQAQRTSSRKNSEACKGTLRTGRTPRSRAKLQRNKQDFSSTSGLQQVLEMRV
ncbi:hypothetical protein Taro_023959 [Colocasia esculenta]|uniref:Uncharacterized protein n=1 Tax=Colocasia esculenta TaxID=4460 RepID=A0A843V637_COLES|nr:hypothetical protein [Colocasia esculenta]